MFNQAGEVEETTQYNQIEIPDSYLRMGDDAVHFENLLIRVSFGDVKLPNHGGPVALAAAAAEVRTIKEE